MIPRLVLHSRRYGWLYGVFLLLIGLGLTDGPNARATILASASASAAAQQHFGVWMLEPGGSEAPLMREAGATWTRVAISWAGTERSPGVYHWGGADSQVNAARAGGFQILLSVMTHP
ncbi:MAG: hypothetical protein RMN24_09875, partial [Anaerolineae bacterium]|nr:hypothetical protein [Anaerolineae bacterium]